MAREQRLAPGAAISGVDVAERCINSSCAILSAAMTATHSEVLADALVVFSAHGVSSAVRKEAARRELRTIDATCPLVTKVHRDIYVIY